MAKSEAFGTGPNGETVTRVFLSGGGLRMNVLTWGSIIQDLRLEGHPAPLVLGFDNMPDYLQHSPFFGVTPGRNRAIERYEEDLRKAANAEPALVK